MDSLKESIIKKIKEQCPVFYSTESSLQHYRFCTTETFTYSIDWLLTGIVKNSTNDSISFKVHRILSDGNISAVVETIHPEDLSFNQLRTILSYINVK